MIHHKESLGIIIYLLLALLLNISQNIASLSAGASKKTEVLYRDQRL